MLRFDRSRTRPLIPVALTVAFIVAFGAPGSARGLTTLDGRAKTEGPVSVQLLQVAQEYQNYLKTSPSQAFQSSIQGLRMVDDRIIVDLAAKDPDAAAGALKALGFQNAKVFGKMISGELPISSIAGLATVPGLRVARPALSSSGVGLVTSQGDVALRADIARGTFGVNGTGVTVGTLSDSYNCLGTAGNDVTSGDLPGGISVLEEGPCPATDEGRGMMQLIADLAPGAAQNFHTAARGQADFAQGILDLRTAGCNIICDDEFYFAEPFFQDGIVAQAVDQVVAAGVSYFALAGNHGRESYQAPYRGGAVDPGFGVELHDFDPGAGQDTRQSISVPVGAKVTFSFQWDQPFFSVSGGSGSASDMDIAIVNAGGTTVLAGGFDNNVGGDPVEVFTFTNAGPATQFDLVIQRVSGPAPGLMKYIALVNGGLGNFTQNEYDTQSSTVYGHMNSGSGANVGAAFYDNTPAFGTNPPVAEAYSSRGGTPILFDTSGNPVNITRDKPDFVSVDGTNTTFFGSDIPDPGDGSDTDAFPNFFGTSAATPHAAAVAALMLDFVPGLSPSTIYTALRSTAIDMASAGFDNDTGYGLIQADAALASLDTTPPVISCPSPLTLECNGDGGVEASDPAVVAWLALVTASDNLDPNPVITNDAPSSFVLGATLVTFTATDFAGNAATCGATVTVEDTTPPVITCPTPNPFIVECSATGGTPADDPQLDPFFAGVSATDTCDTTPTISDNAPTFFPDGDTQVIFTATDGSGNAAACSTLVRVVDTTPPVISVDLNRDVLWPPNHKMVAITAEVTVTDICDPNPTFVLTSITSNEPDNGLGDGDTENDIQNATVGGPDTQFQLRSERGGTGDGRVYTIIYTASDVAGNTAADTSYVRVPHDQSGAAQAGAGFTAEGTSLSPQATSFTVIILGTTNLPVTKIDQDDIYVGNHIEAIRASGWAVRDFNGDRLLDLAASFDALPANLLRMESEPSFSVGLHYRTEEGDYAVNDIFALGAPLAGSGTIGASYSDGGSKSDPIEANGAPTAVNRADGGRATEADAAADPNELAVKTTGRVRVNVFDIQGRRVRTLLDGVFEAGRYPLEWDGRTDNGSRVPSGVYFLRIEAPGIRETRKISVLK